MPARTSSILPETAATEGTSFDLCLFCDIRSPYLRSVEKALQITQYNQLVGVYRNRGPALFALICNLVGIIHGPSGLQRSESGKQNNMSGNKLENLNVASQEALITPEALKKEMPLSDKAADTVSRGRQAIYDIMDGKDHRLFVVVGPCSIHDVDAAMDYARRLKALADRVSDSLYIVMRVYFEKPRTTVGWKGLINDPHLDDSFDIEAGLIMGRTLLGDILELGLPTATELHSWATAAGLTVGRLDDVTPQVRRTWTIVLRRFLGALFTDPEVLQTLLDSSESERVFARTIPRIWLAQHLGALRYGWLVATWE